MITKEQTIRFLANEALSLEDFPDIELAEPGEKYHAFLYLLAKHFEPTRIVELGTYRGESTKYMARGAPDAEILTIDVNPDATRWINDVPPVFANIRAETCNCVFYYENIYDKTPIDLLFIDANHDYSLTMFNFDNWGSCVTAGGLIVLDDLHLDIEMDKVYHELVENRGLSIIDISEVHKTGMGVIIN